MLEDMTSNEIAALGETIAEDPQLLEQHIRGGGTVATFLADWRIARDRAAIERGEQVPTELACRILVAPLCDRNRWRREATVRDYLVELLDQVWKGHAARRFGFIGKPGWEYDLYDVLYRMRLIPGWKDGYGVGYRTDGSEHPEDQVLADNLISAAIRVLVAPVV